MKLYRPVGLQELQKILNVTKLTFTDLLFSCSTIRNPI